MRRLVPFAIIVLLFKIASSQQLSSEIIENRIQKYIAASNIDSVNHYYQIAEKLNLIPNNLLSSIGDFFLEKKMYASALKYYEEAFKNNSYNPQLHYYMYICYGHLGMTDQQNLLASFFNKSQLDFYHHKKNKLENISFFGGTLASNNNDRNSKFDLTKGSQNFGSIDRNGTLNFLYLGAQYRLNNRYIITASINENSINSEQQFQYKYYFLKPNQPGKPPMNQPPPGSRDSISVDTTLNYKVTQPIIHSDISYQLSKSIKLKFSYSVTKTKYNLSAAKPEDLQIRNYKLTTYNNTECTVGLMAFYRKPHYEIGTRLYVMPFSKNNFFPYVMPSDSDRTQIDLSATYFPFRSYTFSIRGQASYLNTQNSYAKLVYTYEINVKIIDKVWLNFIFQHNNLKNFIDLDGAVVYNIDDIIKNKIALRTLIYLGKHFETDVQFGLMQRQSKYITVAKEGSPSVESKITYNNKIINAGVKWNF